MYVLYVHTFGEQNICINWTLSITNNHAVYMMKRLGNIFTVKNLQPPRIELGASVSALPPELWPPGDSQPSQFSISLCMYM